MRPCGARNRRCRSDRGPRTRVEPSSLSSTMESISIPAMLAATFLQRNASRACYSTSFGICSSMIPLTGHGARRRSK